MLSIRRTSILFTGAVGLAVLVAAGLTVTTELGRLSSAKATGNAVAALSYLNKAAIEISFERSLSQVGLALPIPFPDQFRALLDEQRRRSDALFADLDAHLGQADIPGELALVEGLRRYRARLGEIRAAVDPDLRVEAARRAKTDGATIARMKETIAAIVGLGDLVRPAANDTPAAIAAHDLVMQRAWIVREFGGRERTYFAIATALGAPVARADMPEMLEAHGRVLQAFELTRSLAARADLDPKVADAIERLDRLYFEEYEALRRDLYAAADTATYPVDFDTYFARSSEALEAAVDVVVAAGAANIALARDLSEAAFRRVVVIVVLALLALAVTGAAVRYFQVRVAGRIRRATQAMTALADGETRVDIAPLEGPDEVGDMARALAVFRDNSLARARLEAQANDDRSKEVARQQRVEELVRRFRTTAAHVEATLAAETRSMGETSAQLTRVSSDAADQARAAGAAAADADGNVQAVGGAAAALAGSIEDIAREAREASSRIANLSRSLLLVDDSAFFRDMLTPVLKAAGFRVLAAGSAEEALAILSADKRVDVIVTDVEMPGRDGFDLVEAVRAQSRLAHVPVIALASGVTPEAIERARRLRISEFVAKFDRSGLVAALAETQAEVGEAA